METSRYDTYCGLYCGACGALLATERGQVKELAAARGRSVKELTCHGCKTSVRAVYCARCPIRACAVARGVEFCFQCGDYPCAKLLAFRDDEHPHHSAVLRNLERLREVGLDRWLDEQVARWSCPTCHRSFSWYEERCLACGGRLTSCRDEEDAA